MQFSFTDPITADQLHTLLSHLKGSQQDALQRRDIAEKVLVFYRHWNRQFDVHSDSQDLEVITALSKGTATLLGQAMQQERQWWQVPDGAVGLNACAMLVTTLAKIMSSMDVRHRLFDVRHERYDNKSEQLLYPTLEQQGLIQALAAACSRAFKALGSGMRPVSGHEAGCSWCFTQYIGSLLLLCNAIMRACKHTTRVLVQPNNSSPVTSLLLPAAQLATAALQHYLGPDAAGIFSSHCTTRDLVFPTDQLMSYEEKTVYEQKLGWLLAAGVVAQALRVADTLSLACYNAYAVYGHTQARNLPKGSMAMKVLSSPQVLLLTEVMLYLQVKQLHDTQQGRAAAAAPRTARSGRPSQRATGTSSKQPVQVPPHHDALLEALGMGYLKDVEVYRVVTAKGLKPLPGFKSLCLSTYTIDSVVDDATYGLLMTFWANSPCFGSGMGPLAVARTAMGDMVVASGSSALPIRVSGPLNDKSAQAVLLTGVEICLLTGSDVFRGKLSMNIVLTLMTTVMDEVQESFVAMRGSAAMQLFYPTGPTWIEGTNPLDSEALQDMMQPVLTDAVRLLTPLLLPICHLTAVPSEQQQQQPSIASSVQVQAASGFSAQLPQMLTMLAATAGEPCLIGLLEQHPLLTTRALEAALRADWAERYVPPLLRCTLLRRTPSMLSSLGMAAAASGRDSTKAPSKLAAAASTSKQLAAQLHALLTSVAKFGVSLNDAAVQAGTSGSTSSSSVRNAGPDSKHLSSPGQFRGSLALIGSAAGAACKLGRAVCCAAANKASSGPAEADSSAATTTATAPFVSCIGRCMCLIGAAVAAAHAASGMAAAEFDSCASVLRELVTCLEWLQAEPACVRLLDSSGSPACTTEAAAELCRALQSQLQTLSISGMQGQQVVDALVASGLLQQLQVFGAELCSFALGVCANPACRSMADMSELALVAPTAGRKGRGKCSQCGGCSYCSRQCQKSHWPVHKVYCKAHSKPVAAVAEAPAA